MQGLFDTLPNTSGLIVPRPYQLACDAEIKAAFEKYQSALVVMATGCGKTVQFGLLAEWWLAARPGERVLILAHRDELIRQAREELKGILGWYPDVEQAENVASLRANCVVASVQTLFAKRRLDRFPKDHFSLIVCDECHHFTPQTKTYWNIKEHFDKAKLLGVTATPVRGDKNPLGQTFETVCFDYGIQAAVSDGWLVDVEQQFVRVNSLDVTEVDTVKGDFNQGQLSKAMTQDMRVSWEIAASVIEHCKDEPTLIFSCPRPPGEPKGQGEQICDALNSLKPGSAMFLSGETSVEDRRRHLKRYEAGEFPYLIGCSLFTEGFNVPSIANVVMARLTKSIVYYTQAIGRGTRPLRELIAALNACPNASERRAVIAASAKPRVRVFDFVGNSGRHKLISCVDIFAGKISDKARERAKKKLNEGGRAASVMDALDKAEEHEAKLKRAKAKVKTSTEYVNPFEMSDGEVGKKARRDKYGPATPDQFEWIRSKGGTIADGASYLDAGAIIADIKARWKRGECSPKQERTLKRLGVAVGPVPKHHAKALLDLAAHLQWPRGMERPAREQMSIRPEQGGYRLAVTVRGEKVAVGGVFPTADQVRAAYQGMALEPAMA